MPIAFKAPLTSAGANATFVDKTIDDAKKGVLALYKNLPNDVDAIEDIQDYVNEIASTVGITGEGDPNQEVYSSHNYVTSGDNRKVAIGKLDAQAKVNEINILANLDRINVLRTRVDVPNNAFYFGDSMTDGTWRMIQIGTELKIQRRIAGVWTTRDTFAP